jgi:hypothetical protein
MRRILLALMVLGLAMPAEAARRESGKGTSVSRAASSSAQPARATSGTRAQATRTQATRSTPRAQANRREGTRVTTRAGDTRTSRAGIATRSASAATVSRAAATQTCTRRNGRTVCTSAARAQPLRWQAGLPVADYAQRDCPAGTFATLARGHDDVVRCMPE